VVQSGHDPWFVVLNLELENFDVLTSDATTSVTYWMPILSLIMLSLKKRKYEELEQIREMRKC